MAKKKVFVSSNISQYELGMVGQQNIFSFFHVQPLVNYKCENTASKVKLILATYIHVEYDNI